MFPVKKHGDFAVGVRDESITFSHGHGSAFLEIVELAVDRQHHLLIVGHQWLMPVLKIVDRQSCMPHRNPLVPIEVHAFAIRSTMPDDFQHVGDVLAGDIRKALP
jgi:hypothetical protein